MRNIFFDSEGPYRDIKISVRPNSTTISVPNRQRLSLDWFEAMRNHTANAKVEIKFEPFKFDINDTTGWRSLDGRLLDRTIQKVVINPVAKATVVVDRTEQTATISLVYITFDLIGHEPIRIQFENITITTGGLVNLVPSG